MHVWRLPEFKVRIEIVMRFQFSFIFDFKPLFVLIEATWGSVLAICNDDSRFKYFWQKLCVFLVCLFSLQTVYNLSLIYIERQHNINERLVYGEPV